MSTDAAATKELYWAGFDLGGTKMLAKIFDSQYKTLGKKRRKTKGHAGVDLGLERMLQTIHLALEEAGLKPDQLAGIGVGCPGPLDLKKGIIFEAPNLGWYDVPVRDVLQKEFGCPVVICNDVDAGVFGATAAKGELVIFLALTVDTQDADVAGMMMAAGVDAAGNL